MTKDETTDSITTLSARFNEREMAALRQAADAKQWSLSQLIRAGAYEKAVNILNSGSPAAYGVRRMLGRMVEQLFRAKVMCRVDDDDPGRGWSAPFEYEYEETAGLAPECVDVFPTSLEKEDGAKLIDAMRKLGAELSSMFQEEMMRLLADDQTRSLLDPSVPLPAPTDMTAAQPHDESESTPEKPPRRRKSPKKSGGRKES